MGLLTVNNLNKYFGAEPLFREVGLEIQPGEKWGLVGRNGTGKTTLLRILYGETDFDQGEIHWAQGCRVGYLQQEPDFLDDCSIFQELRSLYGDLDDLEAKITGIQERIATADLKSLELETLVNEQHRLQEEYSERGGYQILGRIQGVLRGLCIPEERWEQPATRFSGGERTRLALAKILLAPFDILFLDEPTNYLDLAAIEWLEDYLIKYSGSVVLISHDRFFLDRVVTGIFEISGGRINRFKGNYTSYKQQKENQLEAAWKAFNVQEKELARQERLIREARATEKSKRFAHSLERRLNKVERAEKPESDQKRIKITFQGHQPGSRRVLEVEGVSKNYGSKPVLRDIAFNLEYGEKVALVGDNGAGKTTLLRLLLGQDQPDLGLIRIGYEITPGYFPQDDSQLDLCGTPLTEILAVADLDNTTARTLLGRFLFSGDSVFKEINQLSGGERRRLGMLKLVLSKANLLILDEPTNHLDIEAIEVLEEALLEFDGTVFLVSHDRYFLNKIADRYLAIINGRLSSFKLYDDYLAQRVQNTGTKQAEKPLTASQLQREQTKERQRELRRKQRQLDLIESEITRLEAYKQELLNMVNDPEVFTDYKRSNGLNQDLTKTETELAGLYNQWEELQLELEEAAGLD